MPRKNTPVQWMNGREFKEIRDLLYHEDENSRRRGVDRVKAWKARSRKLPVAIICTMDLVEILLNQTKCDNFKMACTMAVTRLVNLHTEELQQSGRGKPVHELAEKIGLPKWIVDIRHQGTHGNMPDGTILEGALRFCLDWLKSFWDLQVERMEEGVEKSPGDFEGKDRAKIDKAILAYMDMAMKLQNQMPNGKYPPNLDDVLKPLKKPLRGISVRKYVAHMLSQDGCLVPTEAQEKALGIDSDGDIVDGSLPVAVKSLWMPFLDHFKQFFLEPFLVSSIVQRLSKIASRPEGSRGRTVSWYLMGWARELIRRDGVTLASGDVCMEGPPRKRHKRLISWNNTVKVCIMKPNKHSLELLPSLMPLADDPPLSETKQEKLMQVARLMVQGPNGLPTTSNGLPSIEEIERLINSGKRMVEARMMDEEGQREREAETGPGEGASGGPEQAWSVCNDPVDWRKIPLGTLPGQPVDATLLQLSGMTGSRRKRKLSSTDAND